MARYALVNEDKTIVRFDDNVNASKLGIQDLWPKWLPTEKSFGDPKSLPLVSVDKVTEYIIDPSTIVPESVGMAKARLALLNFGLLDKVENAIANSIDPALKIMWEYETNLQRNSSNVARIANAIGLTSSQVDNLFKAASKL